MTLSVMSFNTRGSFHHEDGINAWDKRSDLSIRTIRKYNPDIIGLQEAQTGVIDDYDTHLTEYTKELGLISIRQTERRHYVPIYYREDRFEKVDSGGFYLSETPDKWSIGWDAVYPRSVTWLILRDTTVDEPLLLLNTHYNHERENTYSRTQSSKLIVQQASLHDVSLPRFVMGDFNALPDSDAYRVYLDAGYIDTYLCAGHDDNPNTVHSFQGKGFPYEDFRIDWILLQDTTKKLTVTSAQVILDHEHPVYPSDHYPILTQLEWTTDHA